MCGLLVVSYARGCVPVAFTLNDMYQVMRTLTPVGGRAELDYDLPE